VVLISSSFFTDWALIFYLKGHHALTSIKPVPAGKKGYKISQ
jgi:hypothetical protein